MARMQLVKKVGIKREEGYLYYLDNDGDISRVKGSTKEVSNYLKKRLSGELKEQTKKVEKIMKIGIKKNNKSLYFINKDGDICLINPKWKN